jgi:hypothetical protein
MGAAISLERIKSRPQVNTMRPTVRLLRQWMVVDQSVEAADVTQDVGGKRCRSTFKFSKFTPYFHAQKTILRFSF